MAHGTLIEGNYTAYNNREHFKKGWDIAGAKFSASDSLIWRNNIAEYNEGAGLWCDWTCHDNIVTRNISRFNATSGFHYEKSGYGIFTSNLFYGNGGAGLTLTGSNNNKIYNNTFSKKV